MKSTRGRQLQIIARPKASRSNNGGDTFTGIIVTDGSAREDYISERTIE
ncbi:MAG: hypothetical protein JO138_24600 [Acidobacteriaceae bacterium]|nr:hypothetical protein [Acidobacteriaceae bacterium]